MIFHMLQQILKMHLKVKKRIMIINLLLTKSI